MENKKELFTKSDLLRISTIFGFTVLTLDIIQYLVSPGTIMNSNSFWDNIKYLIWAIGIFYALKWFHLRNPQTPAIKYFGFTLRIASLVSLFDIFFAMLYFNVFNPAGKAQFVDLIMQMNPNLTTYYPGMDLKDQFLSNFNIIFALSLYFSYLFMFMFYSVFYVLFLKLLFKPKSK